VYGIKQIGFPYTIVACKAIDLTGEIVFNLAEILKIQQ